MQTRCMNCMRATEQTQGLCPHCGKPLQVSNEPPALDVSTVLHKRYLIGAVLNEGGEGYTYAAYDMVEDKPVHIREFFPKGVVSRADDGLTMRVNPAEEPECLEWISKFIALYQKLKAMGSTNCIVPCYDIMDENDTVYAVIEAVSKKRTLQQYLNEYFNELSWKQAEFLFIPLLYGLSGLNAAGIVHCGLCPENLVVDEKGKVKIINFMIPQAHCVGSQMRHELYAGYSAPEQYMAEGAIGEWTDVYAFCAILYRVLTGAVVPKGNSRAVSDTLVPLRELNPDISPAVAKAILLGLHPDPAKRPKTFKELLHHLYNELPEERVAKEPEDAKAKTIIIPSVGKDVKPTEKKERRFVEERRSYEKKKKPKVPIALLVLLIALPVALALFGFVYALLLGGSDKPSENISYASGVTPLPSDDSQSESEDSEPQSTESDESSSTGIEVENFIGKFYDDIENNAVYSSLYHFTAVFKYDDTVEKGKIIKQSIEEGTIVPKGEDIEFTVSKGSRYYVVPSMNDGLGRRRTVKDYTAELDAAGISYTIEEKETADYQSGKVAELSVKEGSKIDLENPTKITIYQAVTPVLDSSDIFGSSSDSSEDDSPDTILGGE